jgi:alpha-L-fucosidase
MSAIDRRSFLFSGAAALVGSRATLFAGSSRRPPRQRPRPTPSQLEWQRDELAMFLHFGVNTFTDREWGDGREDPAIFAPARLDAREWARVARAAGFRALVLTAKHHDGFCLWPSRTTRHTVAASPWRGGQGDLVREFVEACRAEGLRPGLYLSPWDRNHPSYGDTPRYNDVYVDQLRELLTNYGDIHEVWFDGANGEGPNGRRQEYDWPRVWNEVRRLQPRAVMFSDAGPDVRWCGNETGTAGDPNWSTVDPSIVPVPGMSGRHIIDALQHGAPNGTVWRPAEADTSIRPGWFHHPAEDDRVRSVDALVDLYFRSVGRNAKLLLNVPPTRAGVLHPTDVARLLGFADRRRALFTHDLAADAAAQGETSGASVTRTLRLPRAVTVSVARIEEPIEQGQTVSRFELSGAGDDQAFTPIAAGTTVGYARLLRFAPRRVRTLRLAADGAANLRVRLFA